jgi:hypothetical protein
MKFSTQLFEPPEPDNKPAWYAVYGAAMLECNPYNALPKIELAQIAIQDRIVELAYLGNRDNREFLDIVNALSHLKILLRSWHEKDGLILWPQCQNSA